MAVLGSPRALRTPMRGQNPAWCPPIRATNPCNAPEPDAPSWCLHPSPISTGQRVTREGLPVPRGEKFPVTQQEQKGPNCPTWGNLAADQGCFASPTGSIHPGHTGLRAGRNHLLEAKFTCSHGAEASILQEGVGFFPSMGSSWSHLGGGVGWRAVPARLHHGVSTGCGGGVGGLQKHLGVFPGARGDVARSDHHVSSPVAERDREQRRLPCARCHPPSSPTWPRPGALEGVDLVWPPQWGKRFWSRSKSPGRWRSNCPSLLGPTVVTGDFQLLLSISREGSTTFQHPMKEV